MFSILIEIYTVSTHIGTLQSDDYLYLRKCLMNKPPPKEKTAQPANGGLKFQLR